MAIAADVLHVAGEVAGEIGHINVVRKLATGEELSPLQRYSIQEEIKDIDTDDIKETVGNVANTVAETSEGAFDIVCDVFGGIADVFGSIF